MESYGPFDCDAWAGGPYGGVADLLRVVVAELGWKAVERHAVELVSVAPDLASSLPSAASSALDRSADVQIRFHPAARTRALAFGLAELLAGWAGERAITVAFDNVDRADRTTVELIDALRRRTDPATLRLTVTGRTMPGTAGAEWHDRRADELAAEGGWAARVAGIPRHRLYGSDPAAAVDAVRTALGLCIGGGFYEHGRRLAERGLEVATPETDPAGWWACTTGLATCLTALGEPEPARDLYLAAIDAVDDTDIELSASASLGVLLTRHLPGDPAAARAWFDRAMALAAELPEPRRTILTVFHGQGVALLDSKTGHHDKALRAIDDGLAALDRVLAPGERRQDRARLVHNRAQVHLALRDRKAALADLDTVIAMDPYNAEYYVDRAALLRTAGQEEAAVADYTTAIRWSPHLPEAYFNRAGLLEALGEPEAALADLDSVLAQDPEHLDALTNRSALRYELGDLDGAEADACVGLAAAPEDPHLLCALGLVRSDRVDPAGAEDLFTRALAAAPDLTQALVNRAAVRFGRDDVPAAVADLTAALAIDDDPVTRFNRGHAFERLGDAASAAADYTAALGLDDGADADFTEELREALERAARQPS